MTLFAVSIEDMNEFGLSGRGEEMGEQKPKLTELEQEMKNATGALRTLFTDKADPIQFAGSHIATGKLQQVFAALEHAWRKAEGRK